MKPTRDLPESYQFLRSIDFTHKSALIQLNIVGSILWIVFVFLFTYLAGVILTEDILFTSVFSSLSSISGILSMLTAIFITIIIHELLHGVSFWFLTRARPKFAFKGAYAYAALPDWYLPRNQMISSALAPFVILTFLGFGILPIIPHSWLPTLILGLSYNAAGSVGDFLAVYLLLRHPSNIFIKDSGDVLSIYQIEQVN